MTKNRSLHLPDDLDEAVRVAAARAGTSVHGYMLTVLAREAEVSRHVAAITPAPTETLQLTNLARGTQEPADAPVAPSRPKPDEDKARVFQEKHGK